ncbi:MAG: NAD-dependent epimerase/dehydratase family protein [Candidatus Dormibacteraeota bacterium]|nr:NAD-dependent epimerase/dehydratase family protein [Candidatus Dormibacteraeota bacterium]MBV9526631.1 NAD-dependent epimerase/dehydratase family protein [Candidatus Dormibacteraeota bacterium]
MRLLVIGGTRFVGRAIVEAALRGGHDVTLFNRGSDTASFPEVPRILGDRNTDAIERIGEQSWDAVVDVTAYRPEQVRSAMRALRGRAAHHVFISTVSVYADAVAEGADESAPLADADEANVPPDPRAAYGELKVLCERAMRDATDSLTVLRPTIVIGEHDPTDRFAWWVKRIAQGGRLRVPARDDQPVQLVDAGDLAAFAVHAAEQSLRGTFNVTAPVERLTLRGMVEVIAGVAGVSVELEHVDSLDFPLCIASGPVDWGIYTLSSAAARGAGLRLRPLRDSTGDVLRTVRTS